MTAISVKELSFAYAGGKETLNSIDFSVEAGETFVIAGLSGCGKTTLCHILCGIIPHSIRGVLTGELFISGKTFDSLAQTARHIGLVFQDSDVQIISTTVEDELAFGLENLCVPREEILFRVDKMLKRLSLSERRLTNPATLSGGQKKLLALGSVLILNPEIVILDEPMTNLDEISRSIVRSAIDELRELGVTVIVVEHDLSLVDYADRIMLLENGSIAALGQAEEILGDKELLKSLEMWFD